MEQQQICVNFEGNHCICFCNEGQTIANVLSSMLWRKKIEFLSQEKSSLQAEKEELKKEKTLQAEESSTRELNASIREVNAGIRELNVSIRDMNTIEQVPLDESLSHLQIYSATGKTLWLNTKLDKTLIDESCSSTKPITVIKEATLPASKRMKYAEVDGAKAASWTPAPSDCNKKAKKAQFENVYDTVPVYYHWFAVILYDALFKDDKPSYFSSPPEIRINILLKQLRSIKRNQKRENEYKCSSVLHLAMQQFFFTYDDCEKAACLSQFPVKDTRRPDFSIHNLQEYFPLEDILYSDYKPENLDEAKSETLCYFVNANEDKFTWTFGLPCTSTHMLFQLYISANQKVLVINLCEVEIGDTTEFKDFLKILYGAVHWRIDNPGPPSKLPLACEPIRGLELRNNFESHPSNRVFFEKETVYKIYEVEDHKKTNYDLMVSLGYFENLELQKIGKTYQLLSYTVLRGNMEPNNIEQIQAAKSKIAMLHNQDLVHGDIRIGNIIFCPSGNEAYLIDFDFTETVGCEYHEAYNRNLDVRHPDIKSGKTDRKEFCHDQYALDHIALVYFMSSVYDT